MAKFKNVHDVLMYEKSKLRTKFLWLPKRVDGSWLWGKVYYYYEHFYDFSVRCYLSKEDALAKVMTGEVKIS